MSKLFAFIIVAILALVVILISTSDGSSLNTRENVGTGAAETATDSKVRPYKGAQQFVGDGDIIYIKSKGGKYLKIEMVAGKDEISNITEITHSEFEAIKTQTRNKVY